MTVDVCQIVLNILKTAGFRAYPDLPEKPLRPVVQVQEIGGAPNRDANRLNIQDFQIDVWGNTKKEAHDTAAGVRDLLINSRNHVTDNGEVITGVSVRMPIWSRDEDFPVGNRPGPRYMMIASATAHA